MKYRSFSSKNPVTILLDMCYYIHKHIWGNLWF